MNRIKWYISDKTVYDYLISNIPLKDSCIIKRNIRRTLYKIPTSDTSVLFIKHDHPSELRHKLKALLFPKAKLEYDSALLLNKIGIPTVPVLGWGKKGSESFLITKEITGAIPLTDLFSHYLLSKKDMNNLLTDISDFLRLLVEKEVKHPDLHPGNILVKSVGKRFSFYLVDLYGIKMGGPFRRKDIFRLFGWLVTILWSLDEAERRKILIRAGFSKNNEGLQREWLRLASWRLRYIKTRCRKRREKLFQNSSICKAYSLNSQQVVIKKELEIKQIKKCYITKRLPNYEAEKGWLNSYFLGLFGIPVLTHYVWVKGKDGSIVIMEHPDNITLKDVLKRREVKEISMLSNTTDKLYDWCNRAGIKISLEPDKVYVMRDAVFPLIFSNPEKFSVDI